MQRLKTKPRRRVSILDFTVAVVGFVGFSILAGFLAAALVLPGIGYQCRRLAAIRIGEKLGVLHDRSLVSGTLGPRMPR